MKKYGKRKTKKRAIKKRAKGPRTSIVRNPTSPFPDRFFTRLQYSQLTSVSYSASSSPGRVAISINSLFQPISGGHQPLGFDQYALLYSRYRVYGMKYHIICTNRETTYQAELALVARPNTEYHTVMDTACESPYAQRLLLDAEGSGQAIKTFKGFASVSKVCGISKTRLKAETDFQALTTASPAEAPTLTLYYQNQNTDQGGSVALRVTLVYYCEFFQRKILTAS